MPQSIEADLGKRGRGKEARVRYTGRRRREERRECLPKRRERRGVMERRGIIAGKGDGLGNMGDEAGKGIVRGKEEERERHKKRVSDREEGERSDVQRRGLDERNVL